MSEELVRLSDIRFYGLKHKDTEEYFTKQDGTFMYESIKDIKKSVTYANKHGEKIDIQDYKYVTFMVREIKDEV